MGGWAMALTQRPQPPIELLHENPGRFVPDEAFGCWIAATFVEDGGELYNPDHKHLQFATIGVLWTDIDQRKAQRTVIGQAELMPPMAMGKWQRERACQQVEEWFGGMPDFLLTFHAYAAHTMDDVSFCALVEHELYHCAQKTDEFGAPKFGSDGRPSYAIKGHDVEEFVGVVSRYGMNPDVARMVEAAKSGPSMPRLNVARACGTCALRSA